MNPKFTYPDEEQGLVHIVGNYAGHLPLYHRYPGQSQAQGAYLELDEEGEVSASWNPEIGSAVPEPVFARRTLRYRIPADLSARGVAALYDEVRPLLERIHAGHSVAWNGKNTGGQLTADAKDASETLDYYLYSLEPDSFERDELELDEA